MFTNILTVYQRLLLLAIWLGTIVSIFLPADSWWVQIVASGLGLYILSALPQARRETLIIVALIGVLSTLLLITDADSSQIINGLQRTLVFAALLPTLQLTRATARRLPAVQLSQQRMRNLPLQSANISILLGSQLFGAVLNTGAFAMMSAVIPGNATEEQRRSAALASLRGMNIAVLWSPFFVGFAVANTYWPTVALWQIMPLGLVLVVLGLTIALFLFARPLSREGLAKALYCLRPLLLPMISAASLVIVIGLLTPLKTLGAILVIMPVVCWLQLLSKPDATRIVSRNTYYSLSSFGDDLLIISAAMILGTLAETAPIFGTYMTPILSIYSSPPAIISMIISIMIAGGLVGLHPMISGTILAVGLTQAPLNISDLVLMESLLIGWGLTSMTSLSSLSVITAGAMYQVSPLRIFFSLNIMFVFLFGSLTVLVLSFLN